MHDLQIETKVRGAITQQEIVIGDRHEGPCAVIIGSGHSDVGPTGDVELMQVVSTFSKAQEKVEAYRERVISQFLKDIGQIRDGIKSGHLIDDGSHQFVTAMIVHEGPEEEIVSTCGFSIACNPNNLDEFVTWNSWEDESWSELFGSDRTTSGTAL